jgi:hypothetical protein
MCLVIAAPEGPHKGQGPLQPPASWLKRGDVESAEPLGRKIKNCLWRNKNSDKGNFLLALSWVASGRSIGYLYVLY